MDRAIAPSLIAVIAMIPHIATAQTAKCPRAEYAIHGALESDKPAVTAVAITVVGPKENNQVEWQMDVQLAAGKSFAVRAIGDRAPMTNFQGARLNRYQFRDTRGKVTEYRHVMTNQAVLPKFNFLIGFLPNCRREVPFSDGFATAGEFMGHIALLKRVTQIDPPPGWTVDFDLKLNPDLMIGVLYSLKDDGTGPHEDKDYRYVEFTKADYDEVIEAGCNYFGHPPAAHRGLIQDQPVFFNAAPDFPEDFYRSNYNGTDMFADEPGIRLGLQYALIGDLSHPSQVADLLVTRLKGTFSRDGMQYAVHNAVKAKTPIGTLDLKIDDLPIWETLYESAYYSLSAGAGGIVQEGRFHPQDTWGWHPQLLFGPGLELTPEQIVRVQYSVLRGAGRIFNKDWGTSIYGQCDTKFREPALTVAFDMGARWFWFWTSDHDHHVPHAEKLRLMAALRDHAKGTRYRWLPNLRRMAETVIALPWGYALAWDNMFNLPPLSLNKLNPAGVPYREAVSAAAWEAILCAMRGEEFDFISDYSRLDDQGYKKVIRIDEDGSVRIWPPVATRPATTDPTVEVKPLTGEGTKAAAPTDHVLAAGGELRWAISPKNDQKPTNAQAIVTVTSLSPLPGSAAGNTTTLAYNSESKTYPVSIRLNGSPGRYRVSIAIQGEKNESIARIEQTIFVYGAPQPPASQPGNR